MEGVPGKRQCIFSMIRLHLMISMAWLIIASVSTNTQVQDSDNIIDGSLEKFVDELQVPLILKGYKIGRDGEPKSKKLTIGMYNVTWKFHRDLPPTRVFAFGTSASTASVPGPTIEAMANVKTKIRWENHLPESHIFPIDTTLDIARPKHSGVPTVVHLHGAAAEPASDGHPRAWFTRHFRDKGEKWKKSVYQYHNPSVAGANLWYHDHTLGITRLNLLAGLLGAYKIVNPAVESRFRLPSGKFDVFLVVTDRDFTKDGQLYVNSTGVIPSLHPHWQPETFGDVIIVNGKAWPYMKVERRLYRFRIVNSSGARFYNITLNNGSLTFTQVSSDSFYLARPVMGLSEIVMAPSEIADVVVDFSPLPVGSEILMQNSAPYPYPSGDPVNALNSQIMKFVVVAKRHNNAHHHSHHEHAKAKLKSMRLVKVVRLKERDAVARRDIVLTETTDVDDNPMSDMINFAQYGSPVTETPRRDTTEAWRIINLTEDNHPFHVHVAAFQAVSIQRINDTDSVLECAEEKRSIEGCGLEEQLADSPVERPPENEAGWKNVFKVPPGHVVTLLLRFSLPTLAPYPFDPTADPGYAYHCHILNHEDNTMMRPFIILP